MKGTHGFLYFLVVNISGFLDGLVANYFFGWKVTTKTEAIVALVGAVIFGVLLASIISAHYEFKVESKQT